MSVHEKDCWCHASPAAKAAAEEIASQPDQAEAYATACARLKEAEQRGREIERADSIAWLRTAQALHDRARTGARLKRERDDAEVSHHYIKAAADSLEEGQHVGAAARQQGGG